MQKGHPHEMRCMGPYYRHHPAYFCKARGPPGEVYLEGLLCWLSQVHEGNYLPVLKKLQECLREATLPLTKWANHEYLPPPPTFLHQNYPMCHEWMGH